MSGTRRTGAAQDAACNTHDTGFKFSCTFFPCHDNNTEKKQWNARLSVWLEGPADRCVLKFRI